MRSVDETIRMFEESECGALEFWKQHDSFASPQTESSGDN